MPQKRKKRKPKRQPLSARAREERAYRARQLHFPVGSKEFLISQHWYEMRDILVFDRERILRLCEAMQVTPRELAMMVRQTPGTANRWLRGEKVNPTVAIHFLMFERAALGMVSEGAERPLFPEGVVGE